MDEVRKGIVSKLATPAFDGQQARPGPVRCRFLGNEVEREVVVEVDEVHVVFLAAAKNGASRSIGIGNSVVELFSVATSERVCR